MAAQPETEAPGPALNLKHLPLLEKYGGRRTRAVLAALAAGQTVWPLVKYAHQRFYRRSDFTIRVLGTDEVYADLHEWVLERLPKQERRALIASTVVGRDVVAEKAGDGWRANNEAHLRLRYDGRRRQTLTIDGHKVVVEVQREEMPDRQAIPDNWLQRLEHIIFSTKTAAGRDAVVAMLDGLLARKYSESGPPPLYMPNRWGNEWRRRGDLPPRTLDSIVLKDGELEDLTADFEHFLRDEDYYVKTSQPWHRGYIFHGVPGTGKTSVARAVANHFGLPTYYLPLGDLNHDMDLMTLMGMIEPRSVLLLEDVDVYHAATERDEQKEKVSVASMLNALDGVWTPHGLITIMTTNNCEALDDALTRPGRMDKRVEFSVLDASQAERLARHFGVEDLDVDGFVGSSPSELIESLRQRRKDAKDHGALRACSDRPNGARPVPSG